MTSTEKEILFIQGGPKTGTSTLVGILNCHPEIFMLYETNMGRALISKYGNQLLTGYPEARRFFRTAVDIGAPYKNFAAYLEKQCPNNKFRYVGDKIISLDPDITQHNRQYKTIYALRNIRTWLCKEQIVKYYRSDLDIVPVAIDYLRYVIGTYKYPNCLRIRLEDLVERNKDVLSTLSSFLGLDLIFHADHWWSKIGSYSDEDPKSLIQWYSEHTSSKIKPDQLDTRYELNSNTFWEVVLPIFEKYYHRDNPIDFDEDEINRDLVQLEDLMRYSPLPLEKCYREISTQRLQLGKSIFFRVLRRLDRVKQAALGKTVLK